MIVSYTPGSPKQPSISLKREHSSSGKVKALEDTCITNLKNNVI